MIRKVTGEAGWTGTNTLVWDSSVKTVFGTFSTIPFFQHFRLSVKLQWMSDGMISGILQKCASLPHNVSE
jgi:hypothetical protein